MTEFKDVPYRKWGEGRYKGKLIDCPEGKRVMELVGKEMKAGRAVELWQSKPAIAEKSGNKIYDTISVIIHD